MNWFKNLNAMPKLMLSSGVLLAFTTLIGFIGTYVLSNQNTQVGELFKTDFSSLIDVKEFEVAKAKIATFSRNAIIAAASDSKGDVTAEVKKQEKQFDATFKTLQARIQSVSASVRQPQARLVVDEIVAILPAYEERSRAIFEAAKAGDAKRASAALASNTEFLAHLNSLVSEVSRLKLEDVEEIRSRQEAQAKSTAKTLIGLVIGTIILGLVVSYAVSRSFSLPLRKAVEILAQLSAGDLTKRLAVTTTDEFGQLAVSLNEAMESMQTALSEVGDSSRNLTHASRQLATAAEALASGAQEQAASLEQTSASLEQITATVRQNSDNAKHASQLAVSSRDSAEKGGKSANDTMVAMADIQASSSKIAEIISTIDEIAFQTNLLSVNASVEAARAGAHGKGFKVVAAEVRNLAQRSATAAKEIKVLIHGSVRKVENGSALVTSSSGTLKEIVTSVKRVSDIVGEIAAASAEQTAGIEQVGKAMLQMDQVTQANSSQTEELSATAASLAEQSSHLQELVSRFVLTRFSDRPLDSFAQSSSVQNGFGSRQREISPSANFDAPAPGLTPLGDSSLTNLASGVGHSAKADAFDSEFEEF